MKKVIVEFKDGYVLETLVAEADWDSYYASLESNETVDHYTVDNIDSASETEAKMLKEIQTTLNAYKENREANGDDFITKWFEDEYRAYGRLFKAVTGKDIVAHRWIVGID